MAATTGISGFQSRHEDIFRSVFPLANFITPTPESTPNIGVISSPGDSFGSFNVPESAAEVAVRSMRAWSEVSRFLSLSMNPTNSQASQQPGVVVQEAFFWLLNQPSGRKSLVAWYASEVSAHFRGLVLPELTTWHSPIAASEVSSVLSTTVKLLQDSQKYYLQRPEMLCSASKHEPGQGISFDSFVDEIKHNLHVLVLHSLPRQRLQRTLASVLYQHMERSLAENSNTEKCLESQTCQCRLSLESLPLYTLHDVGLGDNFGERAFALAVHKFLTGPAIQRRCFQVDWSGQSTIMRSLGGWIKDHFVPSVEHSLSLLTGKTSLKFTPNDVRQFTLMATSNLGRQRTTLLFDYVKAWPESKGALLDIKECLCYGDSSEKARVCSDFAHQIQQRLLHAGASTADILSIYVNVIHAFKLLDARGVLLEKVAGPIRSYLRARDDTVSIIAASFLAETDGEGNVVHVNAEKVCPDITVEVANSSLGDSRDRRVLDWDDMSWVPDPIDAGPEYKPSKSEDILAYVLGLFEQEDFVKEVTTVFAQHLLRANDSEYVKETRLIELFKSRLDATRLQAAEVMLKDVRDSVSLNKRINPRAKYCIAKPPAPREIQAAIPEEGITLSSLYQIFEHRIKQTPFKAALSLVANRRNDLYYPKRTRLPPEAKKDDRVPSTDGIDYKVQVVSSFFWPRLRSNEFDLPTAFEGLRGSFQSSFHALGSQRKLHFRPALARISVELQLEDRTVKEENIPAWRASIINAFASERDGDDDPLAKDGLAATVAAEQLVGALSMEEELVQDALSFWSGRRVLYQPEPGRYAVLERLDMDTASPQRQPQVRGENISAVMSQNAMLRENAQMLETFVSNMLRNDGPKEIGGMMGITNMLKMVLPTFVYGEEEVRWLLSEMEGKGEVVRNGDMWSVAA